MNLSAIRTCEERNGKKKTGTWSAEIGSFFVQGQPSKATAVEALLEKVADFNPIRRTFLFSRNARGRCEDAPCCGCCTI
jgi:hypothetical protein